MESTLPLTIDQFHNDVKVWKSNIALITDELKFIENLIHSYVFEPRTPNLFERLEQYKVKAKSIKKRRDTMEIMLKKHDAELSGMLECDTVSCDTFFKEKHLLVKEEYRQFVNSYNSVKTEIFNYCGTILRTNKQ